MKGFVMLTRLVVPACSAIDGADSTYPRRVTRKQKQKAEARINPYIG